MMAGYAAKTNIGVGVGLILQFAGRLGRALSAMGRQDQFVGQLGLLVELAGMGLFLWGCCSYTKGKGYHPALGLLGLLICSPAVTPMGLVNSISILVLIFLPDKHK